MDKITISKKGITIDTDDNHQFIFDKYVFYMLAVSFITFFVLGYLGVELFDPASVISMIIFFVITMYFIQIDSNNFWDGVYRLLQKRGNA